jgi:hypothetical protein
MKEACTFLSNACAMAVPGMPLLVEMRLLSVHQRTLLSHFYKKWMQKAPNKLCIFSATFLFLHQ